MQQTIRIRNKCLSFCLLDLELNSYIPNPITEYKLFHASQSKTMQLSLSDKIAKNKFLPLLAPSRKVVTWGETTIGTHVAAERWMLTMWPVCGQEVEKDALLPLFTITTRQCFHIIAWRGGRYLMITYILLTKSCIYISLCCTLLHCLTCSLMSVRSAAEKTPWLRVLAFTCLPTANCANCLSGEAINHKGKRVFESDFAGS